MNTNVNSSAEEAVRDSDNVLTDPLFEQVDEVIARVDATIAKISDQMRAFCRRQNGVCGSCFHQGNCCLKQKVEAFTEQAEELAACA